MIGTTIQHYRVLRQLGAGGMGVVYEAEDTRLGRHVALKFLPESHGIAAENVERFLREARIASSLNHPNICTIYDVGVHEGRHFIAMELLEGESLRGRIHGRALPADQTLEIGGQLADALDAAHAKGIIHRDIKPANVFLTKRGQAKLLDFGIAKLGDEPHAHDATAETRIAGEALTTPGMAVGSINYMSPEQARGENLDQRTDLFSLGLVLYEMATGREAFEGKTTAVVFDAILNRQPAEPRLTHPEVPEELQRVIMRALEKDRRMRFQSAADMLAELGRIRRDTSGRTAVMAGIQPPTGGAGSGPTTIAAGPATAASAPAGSRAGLIAAAVALVVALGAGAYYFLSGPSAPPLTQRDSVLVADFTNTTGDAVFDDALKQAVSVQLQQTPFLTLLPDARVQRTLRLMQRPSDDPVTGAVAREVCQRAGAKATVEGSIGSLGSAFVIAIGAHNCETGATLAQAQVQASSKEDVLNQIGIAVRGLRERLGESLATIEKYDVPVTEATTSSLEALRAYGQGLRARVTRGDEASILFFKQAVERDPSFALAYAKLGVVHGNTGRQAEAAEYAKKAYELRDKVSEYERLYINWNHAARVLQDQKATKEALELLTTAYPRDFAARNNLGVYYNNNGQYEEALTQYRAATEIAPDEPGPISNAAYVLFALNRLDEASAAVDRAAEIRPEPNLAVTRWLLSRIANHPRAAEFEQIARGLAGADQVALADAALAAWTGRFKAFQQMQNDVAARARATGNADLANGVELGQTITLAAYRRGADLQHLRALAAREKNPAFLVQQVSALAALGELDAATAGLKRLNTEVKTNATLGPALVVARAYLQARDGHQTAAIAALEAQIATNPRALDIHFFIGDIRQQSGDIEGAIASYRKVVDALTFLGVNPLIPTARLKLAGLLVKIGDTKGAAEQLDALLTQWKEAEEDFPALVEARALRATLK